jgi:hypothetical protein
MVLVGPCSPNNIQFARRAALMVATGVNSDSTLSRAVICWLTGWNLTGVWPQHSLSERGTTVRIPIFSAISVFCIHSSIALIEGMPI